MLYDGISRQQLLQLAITTLKGATAAGDRVFGAADWPTRPELFPILLISAPRERKVAIGNGVPQFNATILLVVVARVVDLTPEAVQAALDRLAAQVEDALLSATDFTRNVQQFAAVDVEMAVTGDGKAQLGEASIRFEIEVYQVYGPDGPPLTDIQGKITNPETGDPTDVAFNVPLPQ